MIRPPLSTAFLRVFMLIFTLMPVSTAQNDAKADPWFEAGRAAVERAKSVQPITGKAKNVILFIGDGMGITTVTASRIFEGQTRKETGEENLLAFEKFPYTAFVKTYNTNAQVPDSAGTMTAIMTGVKTRIGVLGVNEKCVRGDHKGVSDNKVTTLLELAEERGFATGIVTTTRVTHATPAACYAHCPNRDWEDDSKLSKEGACDDFPDIALQLVEFNKGDGIDIILGGGRANFMFKDEVDPESEKTKGRRARKDESDRNLIEKWQAKYSKGVYVWNQKGFDKINAANASHVLGLFEPSHMRYEHDRAGDAAGEPSLSTMTQKAIELLSRNSKGFFLMVEGGRIDHAHHETNAFRALTDTVEFSNAVAAAVKKTNRAETLIIVTADHSHVLTMAGYPTRGNPILGKVNDSDGDASKLETDLRGNPFTTLSYANGPGYVAWSGRKDLTFTITDHPDYKQETTVPLTDETHGGEDVPLYADGPQAHLFRGVLEQNVIFHVMADALGLAY